MKIFHLLWMENLRGTETLNIQKFSATCFIQERGARWRACMCATNPINIDFSLKKV